MIMMLTLSSEWKTKKNFFFELHKETFYFNNATCFSLSIFISLIMFADNDLYIGTDADFSGNDPIIYR